MMQSQKRWGILAMAVGMFFVTAVAMQIFVFGNSLSLFVAAWIMIGWHSYKGDVQLIKFWAKWTILAGVGVVILLYFFMGYKAIDMTLMMVPLILLYFYMVNQSAKYINDARVVEPILKEEKMTTKTIADLTPRVIGSLIDLILVLIISSIIIFVWAYFVGLSGSEGHMSRQSAEVIWNGRGILVGLLVDMIYTIGLQAGSSGATFGQKSMGLRLVTVKYENPTLGALILRYFMSLVSSIFLKIGFLIALFNDKKQTLQDIVAGTLVVREGGGSTSYTTLSANNQPKQNTVSASTSSLHNKPTAVAASISAASSPVKDVDYVMTKTENTTNNISEPLAEDWEKALNEYEGENRIKGLWAKLFADNNGDENIVKAQYIKFRAAEIAAARRKEIEDRRSNIYSHASNEDCIKNSAMIQIKSTTTKFPVFKLANGNYAIYASWRYKTYSSLENLNKAIDMFNATELFSKDGFIEDVVSK